MSAVVATVASSGIRRSGAGLRVDLGRDSTDRRCIMSRVNQVIVFTRDGHSWVLMFDRQKLQESLRNVGRMVSATDGLFSWSDAAIVCSKMRSCTAENSAEATR